MKEEALKLADVLEQFYKTYDEKFYSIEAAVNMIRQLVKEIERLELK